MGIFIHSMRIENFRSLKNITLDFADSTVLIGKNNSGKSNIIKALELAFSFGNTNKEDVFTSKDEPFNYGKKIFIDVKILPKPNVETSNEFDGLWGRSLGNAITSDEVTDTEFFAFRTEISYDNNKEMFVNNKYVIKSWTDDAITTGDILKRSVLDSIDAVSVQAQRDISFDIRDRKSVWGKLVSKIKISEDIERKIVAQLSKLNKSIIKESDILKIIEKELKNSIRENNSKIDISPLTRDIESLYKGMDIIYSNDYVTPTSIENLGLGLRSWAVFSTIKSEIIAKVSKAESDDVAYHSLVLAEEPEVHIHPQAQRQLFSTISSISGQKIFTTHSPFIISQVALEEHTIR